ncbi:MAG: hypothetical protein K2J82_00905 [Muribaculaceae bacterium]|nr:hypothetical protein [Muribaculaceae bacterium]MDE6753152.1 hypothetical protein [Muribaculaceae bacterium]
MPPDVSTKIGFNAIITCYIANEDYPEDLKIEIIHAIDDKKTGFCE